MVDLWRHSELLLLSEIRQLLIGEGLPKLPPILTEGLIVPSSFLLAPALSIHTPKSRHGVEVRVVATEPVEGNINDHTLCNQVGEKPPAEGDLPRLGKLAGKGNLELPGELGVLPRLGQLHGIPEGRSILHPLGSAFRKQDLGVDHARLAREVFGEPGALIVDPRRGSVGCSRSRTATGGSADELHGEAVDGHGAGSLGGVGGLATQPSTSRRDV
jgi:hypothetical protein